jgi:hypothetical protein
MVLVIVQTESAIKSGPFEEAFSLGKDAED